MGYKRVTDFATARQRHDSTLLEADVSPSNGKRALREVEKELEKRRQARHQAKEEARRHQASRDKEVVDKEVVSW